MSTVLDLCLQRTIRPGDSCINQLIAIHLNIFEGFDGGLEVRSVFLIHLKHSPKCGLRDLFTNYVLMAFVTTYHNYSQVSLIEESNRTSEMFSVNHGVLLMLEFHKVRYLDLWFFYLYTRFNWKPSLKSKTFTDDTFLFTMIQMQQLNNFLRIYMK